MKVTQNSPNPGSLSAKHTPDKKLTLAHLNTPTDTVIQPSPMLFTLVAQQSNVIKRKKL